MAENNTDNIKNSVEQNSTNVSIIIKAFNDTCKTVEKIDKTKLKVAVKNLLDIKVYLIDFMTFTSDISAIINNEASKLDSQIVESQSKITDVITKSFGIIKTLTEYKFPNIFVYQYQLWRYKTRLLMLLRAFFDAEEGIAGYLSQVNASTKKNYTWEDENGEKIKGRLLSIKELYDDIKSFSSIVEEVNDITDKIINTTKNTVKNVPIISIGLKTLTSIFDKYSIIFNGIDLRMMGYKTVSNTLENVSNNIGLFMNIVNSIIETYSGNLVRLKTVQITLPISINIVKQLVQAINHINEDESGKPVVLANNTRLFTTLTKEVVQINELIKTLGIFNLNTLIITTIASITIGKILRNVQKVILKINNFAIEIKQQKFNDITESITTIAVIIDAMLGLIGGIILLALAAPVLILAAPVALISISLIVLFVKVAVKEFRWISRNNNTKMLVKSTANLAVMITLIMGSMLVAATAMVLLAMLGVTMLKLIKPALLTFAVVSLILLAVAGLAMLINLMLKSGFGNVIYRGMMAILAIIGTMLVVSVGLILLGMIGQALVHDKVWLYALGVIAGVGLLMLAFAALGLLLLNPVVATAILASTLALVLTTISVTAILLTAAELILLSKINFDDNMVDTIKANTKLVIDTALDIMGMIFQNIEEDPITGKKTNKHAGLFRTLFKGAAILVEALVASAVLVLTVISVAAIIIVAGELILVSKIKVDRGAVKASVNNIMMGAQYCIDAVFGDYDAPEKRTNNEKYKGIITRVLTGIGDILTLVLGVAKLALILASVALVMFVALSLKLIVFTARNMKPAEIREATSTILGSAQYCIDAIFEPVNEPEESESGSKFKNFVQRILSGVGDVITIVMGIGKLALTLTSVAIVMFIAKALKNIITTAAEFDRPAIENSLGVIMNCADYCRELIFNPAGPGFVTESKDQGFGSKFISFVGGVFKNIGGSIGALMSIGRVASTLAAVAIVVFISEKLKAINTAAAELNSDTLKKSVLTIINTSDLVVKTINTADFDKVSGQSIKGLKSINEMFEVFLRLITTYKGITKEGVDIITYSLQTIVPELNNIEITVDTKLQKKLYENLALFVKIISTKLEQTRDGVDLIVYAINTIIPALNNIDGSVNTKDIKKTIGALDGFINVINVELHQTKEGIDIIAYAINTIIPILNSIDMSSVSNLTQMAYDTNYSIKCLISAFNFDQEQTLSGSNILTQLIDNINSYEIDNTVISSIDDMATVIGRLFDAFNKNSKNAERGIDKSIEFINKVNDVRLDNLQTTARLFEKMADFSESINGNFDGLADALNEKIAPLIEKLNKSLEETKSTIQSSEAAIERAKAAATELNAKIEEGKAVAGTDEKKNEQKETGMNMESTNIATNLRDIKKLLAGNASTSGGRGLLVRTTR